MGARERIEDAKPGVYGLAAVLVAAVCLVGLASTQDAYAAVTVTIDPPTLTLTTAGPVDYVVRYVGARTVTLTEADIRLNLAGTANGTVTIQPGGGRTQRTVRISSITGDGTIGISVAAGSAVDASGNLAPAAGPSATFTVDNTAPTISIGAPSASLTRTGPITYTITYGGADAVTLAAGNVTLNRTGTANGTVGVSGTGLTTRTVTISSITGDGTVGISIAAGTASDTVGNLAAAAGPTATFTVDNTPPTISIGAPSSSPTRTGPVTYTIAYTGAAAVTLAAGNVTLNRTGTANGSVAVTGTGNSTRTVTISSITGDGTIGISIAASTASDAAGNLAAAAGPSTTFTVDNIAPTISIGAPSASLTRTGPVTYTITYSGADSVSLVAGNVTLNQGGTANGTVTVTGTGNTTRTVTISSITGDGTLGISVAAGTASDNAGNSAPAAGPSTTFTVDNTAPTISIGSPSAAQTRTGPITYGSADSVALAAGNVTLNKTGTANGTVAVSGTGNTTRTVTISSITGDGTLGISVAAGTAHDAVGNSAPARGPSSTFSADNTAPTMTIGDPSDSLTRTGPIAYLVTYSGASAITLGDDDVTLNATGTADGVLSVSGSGTSARTVTISGITGDGTLVISIGAGTAQDAAGNLAPSGGPSGAVTVDNTPPTLAISAPSTVATRSGPVTYTVTYSDADSISLADGDVLLTATGTATGLVAVSGSEATSRTVTISSITGDGTLAISIGAGTASDAAGNPAAAAGPSDTVSVDSTGPLVSIGAPSVTLTGTGPITYTVSYSGADAITLADADILLNASGTATGVASVSGSGSGSRLVTISGIQGDGALGISLASGTASDTLGNLAPGAGPSGEVSVDNTAPVVTLHGEAHMLIVRGTAYVDPGAEANDTRDGDLTGNIVRDGSVDTANCVTYEVIYHVADAAGNEGQARRTIEVAEPGVPEMPLEWWPLALVLPLVAGVSLLRRRGARNE